MQPKTYDKTVGALATGGNGERLSSKSSNINERRDRAREHPAGLRVERIEFRRMLINMPVMPEVLCCECREQQKKASNLAQSSGDVTPRALWFGGNLD